MHADRTAIRRKALVGLALLALLACASPPSPTAPRPSPPLPSLSPSPPVSTTSFAFGVEYGNLDGGVLGPRRAPAATYAAFGARWVKFTDIDWGSIVPREGLKAAGYTWGQLDGWVKEYQAAGFQIQIVLRSRSPWATQPAYRKDLLGGFGKASTPPQPDQWDAYGDWVQRMVERYDGDGLDDMPGLLGSRPILDYEIESEAGAEMFWQGTAEEYLRLLKLAYERAKAANPRASIIASGLGIGDFFDDGAGGEVWTSRTAEMRARVAKNQGMAAAFDRAKGFLDLVVAHPEAFDVVEFHWLTDYKALPGGVDWMRGEMAKHGYRKPVWAGDATSAPNLIVAPAYFPDKPFSALDRGRLVIALNDPNPAAETARWFRAEQARLTVKKLVTGMAAGLEGINFCCLQDWPIVTGFPFQGLTDDKQQPRPVLYSFRLVAQKLAGYTAVKRLDLGQNIYAYQFTVSGQSVFVLWYDDGRYYLPVQKEPSAAVDLPLSAAQVLVTHVITAPGQTEPQVDTLSVTNGHLRLTLDGTPVFVEVGE